MSFKKRNSYFVCDLNL